MPRAAFPALAAATRQVYGAGCVVVLEGQLSLRIRPGACTGIGHAVGADDLGRHAATPLSATRLVRQGFSDQGKSRPLGPSLLHSSVSKRQPLPRPGPRCGPVWRAPPEAHAGSGELVTRPDLHLSSLAAELEEMFLVICDQPGLSGVGHGPWPVLLMAAWEALRHAARPPYAAEAGGFSGCGSACPRILGACLSDCTTSS